MAKSDLTQIETFYLQHLDADRLSAILLHRGSIIVSLAGQILLTTQPELIIADLREQITALALAAARFEDGSAL